MNIPDLVRRLREDAATGLDLSPGNKLSAEAADAIEMLVDQRDLASIRLGNARRRLGETQD